MNALLPPLNAEQRHLLDVARQATAANWPALGLHTDEVVELLAADDRDREALWRVVGHDGRQWH